MTLEDYNLLYTAKLDFPNLSTTYREAFVDWNAKRTWCDQQGWVINKDYFMPGLVSGKWYFRNASHRMEFMLRWA